MKSQRPPAGCQRLPPNSTRASCPPFLPAPISHSHLEARGDSGFSPRRLAASLAQPAWCSARVVPLYSSPAAEGGPRGIDAEMPRQVGGWEAEGE